MLHISIDTGHPNCKLFLTHGGLIGMYETIYHQVPVVVMPGFGDQVSKIVKV